MAGAGYKLYSTGDVLTASDVNTYIQQQTVMVFADASARTTALTGVVAEGMLTYLKDTDVVQYYSGSGWVTVNTDQTPLTTKGDLFTYSTQDARLAVGNNGETLVADSSATTGLRWQGNFAAGKNKIINGDFGINQRSFSSVTANNTYTFDRWVTLLSGGTVTYTPQTFTAGAAPVAGYEGTNFIQIATSGQTTQSQYSGYLQRIEDVRTFAGQTVTLSFWAKATSGTPYLWLEYGQNFGSGGSGGVNGQIGSTVTLSTTWTRYSVSVAIPSISGKTIGTGGTWLEAVFLTSVGSSIRGYANATFQNATIQIWGVQLEAGNVATPFQTATGTLAGEYAAAQRYYQRYATVNYARAGVGYGLSTTSAGIQIPSKTSFRVSPTSVEFSNMAVYDGTTITAATNVTIDSANPDFTNLTFTVASGLTQYRTYMGLNNNSATGYVALSAEL